VKTIFHRHAQWVELDICILHIYVCVCVCKHTHTHTHICEQKHTYIYSLLVKTAFHGHAQWVELKISVLGFNTHTYIYRIYRSIYIYIYTDTYIYIYRYLLLVKTIFHRHAQGVELRRGEAVDQHGRARNVEDGLQIDCYKRIGLSVLCSY